MFQYHDLYRAEHEERVRKAVEENRLRQLLPTRPNWLVTALNQLRVFLF